MTSVWLQNSERRMTFRRIFVRSKFPFLTLNSQRSNVYKSLHFGFGYDNFGDSSEIYIRHDQSGMPITTIGLEVVSATEIGRNTGSNDIENEARRFASDSAGASRMKYATLMLALNGLERREGPSGELLRARIMLNVALLANHKRSFQNLEDLSALTDQDSLDKFTRELAELNRPLTLGSHGYYPSFAELDLIQVENDLSLLFDVIDRFGARGFINSGTLLGYYRDGGPIPKDDDFDVAVIINGNDIEEISDNWRTFKKNLGREYSVVDKGSFVAIQIGIGVQVDVFAGWILNGRLFVYPYCYGDVPASAALPVSYLKVRDQELPIPHDPELILYTNYSDSWKVPDPFWRFDWSRAKKRFRRELRDLKGR